MDQTTTPGFGQHLSGLQKIPPYGGSGTARAYIAPAKPQDPASYGGLANRPRTTRGMSQWIGRPIVVADLEDTDDATDASYFVVDKESLHPGGIDLSLTGTWTGTIELQRCFNADCVDDDGDALVEEWNTVESFTENVEKVVQHYNSTVKWRLIVTSVSFSGTCHARLSQA
jgi:hypothetical protein